MATILNNKINQDKDKDQVGQAPIMNASGTAASTVGGAAGAPQNNNAKPVTSGRFANIQQFLGANKNAGQQVGGQVVKQQKDLSGKLTGAADASKQSVAGVGTEAEAFRKGTEVAKTIQNEQGDLGQFFDTYSNAEATGPQFGNVNQDFTKLAQGKYDQSVIDKAGTDLNKTSSLLNDLSQFSGNLNTESGRQQLLRQAYQNKGNYGQGANALDQAFLQRSGSPLIEQAQKDVRSQGSAVDRSLGNLNKQYSANDALVKQLAGESSQAINSALTGSMSDFDRTQIEQAQNLNKTRAEQQNLMTQFLSTGYQNMDDAQKASVAAMLKENEMNAGGRTYGLDLQGAGIDPYAKKSRTDLTNQDVVDRNEFARIQALTRLSGQGAANYGGPTKENLEAGGITIDKDKLKGDIENSRLGMDITGFLRSGAYATQGGQQVGNNIWDMVQDADFGSGGGPTPTNFIPGLGGGFGAQNFSMDPFNDRNYTGQDMDAMMNIINQYATGGKTGAAGAMSDEQARQAYQALMNAGYMRGTHTEATGSKADTAAAYDAYRKAAVKNLLANRGNLISQNFLGGKQNG